MTARYDWIVVGAGLSGSVMARELAENGKFSVLVVEQRDHVAGNTYDYVSENGHRVHKYGPHIFHTNSEKVFSYLSKFTDWFPYEHKVKGHLANEAHVPIPFNLDTLQSIDIDLYRLAQPVLKDLGLIGTEVPVMKLMSSENSTLREIGDVAYTTLFKGYSEKQWGEPLENLNASVGARVPVRFSTDDRYFRDTFQMMPSDGYEALVLNLLNHELINVALETAFDQKAHVGKFGVIYSGSIDQLNDYSLGFLPYRSLDFKIEHHDSEKYQDVAQVNFTQSEEFTRVTEFKHFTGLQGKGTTIAKEFPRAHIYGETIPYYPIPKERNADLHQQYLMLTATRLPNLVPIGRLADYKYYNMDQVVARALQVSANITNGA